MSKCIVCGCTDERACPGGCDWANDDPPVCTTCVPAWLFARLWDVVAHLEPQAGGPIAGAIKDLRADYAIVAKRHATAIAITEAPMIVPTPKKVSQVWRKTNDWNRRVAKAMKARA